jgi:hypothetical protein
MCLLDMTGTKTTAPCIVDPLTAVALYGVSEHLEQVNAMNCRKATCDRTRSAARVLCTYDARSTYC